MPRRVPKQDNTISVRFGGGLNTRSSRDEVGLREAAAGENFDVDIGNFDLRPRAPFELIGVAPNGGKINGFVTLRKRDGTISFLVQAAEIVYEWDGSTFTQVGTTSINSRLRGTMQSYWGLDDLVIITDLNLKSPIYQYDGFTFEIISFADPTGEFRAKYCLVNTERALYANVFNNIFIPHIIVGSQLEQYDIVTTTERAGDVSGSDVGAFYGDPIVSIGVDSAYFLPVPDILPINGILDAFGTIPISTEDGKIHQLIGSSPQDYQIISLYSGSGASGTEPITFVGNDVLFGREGTIESLLANDKFGDVEASDPSAFIRSIAKDVNSWDIDYDPVAQRAFVWPEGGTKVLVWRKETEGSPWSVWTTNHSSNFNKTASMLMFDPRTRRKSVFWGDTDGNIFKMFGEEGTGDAGAEAVTMSRASKTFSMPADAISSDIEGFVRYKAIDFPTEFDITVEYEGLTLKDQVSTVTIEAPTDGDYYNGSTFYSGEGHYNHIITQRLSQERVSISGQSSQFRVKVSHEDQKSLEVNEIGFKFKTSS